MLKYIRNLTGIIMAAMTFLMTSVAAQDKSAPEQVPTQVIERFHEHLITAMKNAEVWPYEERKSSLSDVVSESFDFGFMARFASGAAWRELEREDKIQIARGFEDFTLANYAARFHGYSGQSFETLETAEQRGGRLLVRTRLVKEKGDPVRLDYLMHDKGKGWRIVDVFLDGKYSELALRRSEFSPVLRDQGVEGLVDTLADRASRLAAGDDSAG